LVKEASALLKLCKEKLQNAELDVDRALSTLNEENTPLDS
jgi:exonuclease VII small subunit